MAGIGVAAAGAGIVLMHALGVPDQHDPVEYEDVVEDVRQFLVRQLAVAVAAGIPAERIALDRNRVLDALRRAFRCSRDFRA